MMLSTQTKRKISICKFKNSIYLTSNQEDTVVMCDFSRNGWASNRRFNNDPLVRFQPVSDASEHEKNCA